MNDLQKNTEILKEYLDCGLIPHISKYKINTQTSIFGDEEVCFKIYFSNSVYGVHYNGQFVSPNNVTLYMSNNGGLLRLFFLFNARMSSKMHLENGKLTSSGVVVESISKKLNIKGSKLEFKNLDRLFRNLLFILNNSFPYLVGDKTDNIDGLAKEAANGDRD